VTQQAQTIAEALNTDPVYVTNAAKGEINDTLLQKAETKIDSLDFDVYVIITGGEGADRDLLEQVKVFNGDEGAFIMIDTNTDLAVDYTFEDQHDLQMQVMEQMSVGREQWSHSTPSQTKLNMLLDLYADPQEAPEYETGQEASGSEVQTVDGSNSTATLFLGGAVLVLALVIAVIWLARSRRERAKAARTRRRFELPARLLDRVDDLQRKTLREGLNEDTTELADEITQLQTQDLSTADAEGVERALDAYQMARGIVDDTEAERIDLAGAMVLLRQAGREIAEVKLHRSTKRGARTRKTGSARASGSTKSAKSRGLPQSLCTVNPLHGEARSNQLVSTERKGHLAGKSVRVPVCGSCLSDLHSGRELQWIFDGDRPYVEGRSVWAQTLFGAIGGDLVTALHRQGS
jgi:organic radical activating enzyme